MGWRSVVHGLTSPVTTEDGGQATSSNRPTYGAAALNGKGVLHFTTAQSLDLSGSGDSQIRTIAAVLKQASTQCGDQAIWRKPSPYHIGSKV